MVKRVIRQRLDILREIPRVGCCFDCVDAGAAASPQAAAVATVAADAAEALKSDMIAAGASTIVKPSTCSATAALAALAGRALLLQGKDLKFGDECDMSLIHVG